MSVAILHMSENKPDDFELTPTTESGCDQFELEALAPVADVDSVQGELYLPESNPGQPDADPQIELEGMGKPVYAVEIHNSLNSDSNQAVQFQHAGTLLDSLEAQNIEVHYQCREGYCGSCRVQLLEGEVHYNEEPMAWINDDEILPCCCIPKSDIKIKID